MKYVYAVLIMATQLVSAQSLLQNGTFDQNINSWESFFDPAWINNDGATASGNGSIRFGDDLNNGSSVWARSELLPIKADYHYIMATSFKRPAASVANGMSMSIQWFDDQENFLGEYPWDQFFDTSQADVWTDFDYAFENIIGEDATQARVYLWVHLPSEGNEEAFGLFDDVIFFQDTVFKSDFD